jgi:hypothetical protein
MPKARTRKKACSKCGVGIRADTAFCYNCGNRLPAPREATLKRPAAENGAIRKNDGETQAALDDLANRFKLDDLPVDPTPPRETPVSTNDEDLAQRFNIDEGDEDDKLAKAAAERKIARIKRRLPAEYIWESATDTSGRFVVLFAFLIAIIAVATVYIMIFWR